MFAIIEDGGRQYRVEQGATLLVDYRADAEAGQAITFDRVLLANGGADSAIGRPLIEGAVVEAEVVNPEFKGEKLEIQKIRRRKNSKRHTGHRQKHTTVLINSISVPGLQIDEQAVATPATIEAEDASAADAEATTDED